MPEVRLFFDEMGELIEFIIEARFFVLSQEYIAVYKRYELERHALFLRVEIGDDGREYYSHLFDCEKEDVKREYTKINKLLN